MTTLTKRILSSFKRAFLWTSLFLVLLAALGVLYQSAGAEADRREHPAPGHLIDVGGFKMHIPCMGAGSPTVLLDSANMGTVSNWAWIQPEIAKTTRVCAYDRADSG